MMCAMFLLLLMLVDGLRDVPAVVCESLNARMFCVMFLLLLVKGLCDVPAFVSEWSM